MNQQIEETASSISLLDLWLMIKRNIYSIIYFTILGLVLGLVYTNVIVTPEYTATGYVAMRTSTTATILNTITEVAGGTTVATAAAETLDADDVTLANGDPITAEMIKSGITASYTSTSLIVTISYKYEQQAITLPVVNAVIDATILIGNTDYTAIGNNLILSSYAALSEYTGPSTILYLAIFVLLGGAVGAGLGIVTDIIEDHVHYAGEIQAAGINAFSVPFEEAYAKPKSKGKKDPATLKASDLDLVDTSDLGGMYYKGILKLQNDIENFTPEKQVKTIAITSTKEYQSKLSLLASLAHVYAKENQRVLVIDFDFQHPLVHEVFGVTNHNNLVAYYLSYKPKEEFVAKVTNTLYVLPGMTSAIGSKIIKSDRIKKLIEEARKEYDYVLINCPPTLNELTILAASHLFDGVLVAGKFQVTKKKEFLKTASTIAKNEMHLIGGAFLSVAKEKKSLLSLFSKSSG